MKLFLRIWRLLRAEIALGFLIASVFWVVILGWQAAYAPTDAEKQKCYDDAKRVGYKAEECKTLWERTTSDPVAFFTLWLVIFTGGLTVSTVLLWRAGERQFRHGRRSAAVQTRDMQDSIAVARQGAEAAILGATAAEDAAKIAFASQRPWLEIESVEIPEITFEPPRNGLPTGALSMRFKAKISNIGATPADNVNVLVVPVISDGDGDTGAFHDSCREALIAQLLAEPPKGRYNRVTFPKRYFEVERATDWSNLVAGSADFTNAGNPIIDIHLLVGVRYAYADRVGYTIVPVYVWGKPEANGRLRFQLAAMKEQPSSVYRDGAHYQVESHWQGVEAK